MQARGGGAEDSEGEGNIGGDAFIHRRLGAREFVDDAERELTSLPLLKFLPVASPWGIRVSVPSTLNLLLNCYSKQTHLFLE